LTVSRIRQLGTTTLSSWSGEGSGRIGIFPQITTGAYRRRRGNLVAVVGWGQHLGPRIGHCRRVARRVLRMTCCPELAQGCDFWLIFAPSL
jgi:hypothetical protein